MAKYDSAAEDLAIQETLSMTVEERLRLLSELIVAQMPKAQRVSVVSNKRKRNQHARTTN